MTTTESKESETLLLEALFTDNIRHKQWYLEEILRKLGYNLTKIRKERQEAYGNAWIEGMPPKTEVD